MTRNAIVGLLVSLALGGLVYFYSARCIEGDCKNGCGQKVQRGAFSFQGCFKNGRAHGFGEFKAVTGDRYEGQWQHGLKSGQGTHWYADGRRYEGNWLDGERHGSGRLYDAAGQLIYAGQWRHNQQHRNEYAN